MAKGELKRWLLIIVLDDGQEPDVTAFYGDDDDAARVEDEVGKIVDGYPVRVVREPVGVESADDVLKTFDHLAVEQAKETHDA